ncbi:MAG: 16S rRNA (cytosine(1402)-N(4))-methyltransferase RsmH [Planctomycetia bacterium]|nr:MAG: 16S rRNA (cytosine(1402)-N(4))-methyltransferase RsmH [Planctomycetia bacterium]
MTGRADGAEHVPVLADAILALMQPAAGQIFVDGTVGLGGHALAILPRLLPGGRYIGLDVDPEMLAVARERLASMPEGSVILRHANYADLPDVLDELEIDAADHVLLDLGVNSAQLASGERGFSIDRDGPLDMRFDRNQKVRALDLVNSLTENELSDLFYQFGQEGLSRRIAKRICQIRHETRITTTGALARAVESVFAADSSARPGKIHSATRIFQALRVAVNRELDQLRTALPRITARLRPGGTLAVIAFHSLEDAIVKDFLRSQRAAGRMSEITKRPHIADEAERQANPRSRSAKLRVARRTTAA